MLKYLIFLIALVATCNDETKFRDSGEKPRPCPTLGDVRKTACGNGSVYEVCRPDGWHKAYDTCSSECGVTFAELRPVISAECQTCHTTFTAYPDFLGVKDDSAARVKKPLSDPGHMPKGKDLSPENKQLFTDFVQNGAKESCGNQPPTATLTFNQIENFVIADLDSFSTAEQPFMRYLTASHRLFLDGVQSADKSVSKTINAISTRRQLVKAQPIDPGKSIFRVDLRDYGISQAEWVKIEKVDKFNFESFTSQGVLIKSLTKTRKALMHFDNFQFSVLDNATLYYDLIGVPLTEAELFAQQGINVNQQFDDLTVRFVGFNGSPITLNKNRLITRFESNDGYYWQTFDTVGLISADRNLFNFPLLANAGGRANFRFDASEVIYSLPNGLQAYALFAANGQRQDAAPLNVVIDNITPFSPEIRNSHSCYRCHAGLIPEEDQVRASVLNNADQFDINDVRLVQDLYEVNEAGLFGKDNEFYDNAIKQVGISRTEPDYINQFDDKMRNDMNAKTVAAYLFLSETEFLQELNISGRAKEQVGQLLNGGSITFDQFLQTLPILLEDLEIARDR